METKVLEIRDEGTHIAALAIRMAAGVDLVRAYYIHARCGYPRDGSGIVLMRLDDQKATVDPYEWPAITGGTRTMPVAHDFIYNHFDELKDGDVVDVRFILKEKGAPVISDRLANPS